MSHQRQVPSTRLAEASVGEWMTSDVVTVKAGDSCLWALRVMDAAGISHLPVLEGERLVGILTERDLHRRAPSLRVVTPGGSEVLGHARVGGAMTYGPITIDPGAPLAVAVSIMLDRGIGGLPVVAGGRVVGMLTTRDVLRAVQAELDPLHLRNPESAPAESAGGARR